MRARSGTRREGGWIGVLFVVGFASGSALAQTPPDPDALRASALARGFKALSEVPLPQAEIGEYVADRDAAVLLGKALFWDMNVGSDGQSCASCHFHAGADNRAKNQLHPGPGDLFGNNPASGAKDFPAFGPNTTLRAEDFPLRRYEAPGDRQSTVLRDTDDVVSSIGVFNADLFRIRPGGEVSRAVPDPIFNVDGINVRKVEPRHTPTVINSIFNFVNFWDGRAQNHFNGVSPFGEMDDAASILVNENGALVEKRMSLANSSLASQAVGPPLSTFEMSFGKRHFAHLGRKVLAQRALSKQYVHPLDSVLGPTSLARLSKDGRLQGRTGLSLSYDTLIKQAFKPELWNSPERIAYDEAGQRIPASRTTRPHESFSQLEANFSLFFGLAVQLYESTLVSDRSPFDAFMLGDDTALSPAALEGLSVFLGRGACSGCHSGAEFTAASTSSVQSRGAIRVTRTPVLNGTRLSFGGPRSFQDTGFFNIGVRTIGEDPGRAGSGPGGLPLSFTQQALTGLPYSAPLPDCGENCPLDGYSAGIEGAFKSPTLRNVALTGPYFHNGGQATLGQVIDFYKRQGDSTDAAPQSIGLGMVFVRLTEADREPLIRFLEALTDERVRQESAPFDHPQLLVPNGHPGDEQLLTCTDDEEPLQACDAFLEIPAVGAAGRSNQGLAPLQPFLELDPLD